MNLIERHIEAGNIEIIPWSGCWLWLGPTNRGYGSLWYSWIKSLAHRVSWELFRGPIPDGLYVLHKCDIKCCVNPDHLYVGTQADNIQDTMNSPNYMPIGANAGKQFCRHGHEFTPENTYQFNGHRQCRTCKKLWARLDRAKI